MQLSLHQRQPFPRIIFIKSFSFNIIKALNHEQLTLNSPNFLHKPWKAASSSHKKYFLFIKLCSEKSFLTLSHTFSKKFFHQILFKKCHPILSSTCQKQHWSTSLSQVLILTSCWWRELWRVRELEISLMLHPLHLLHIQHYARVDGSLLAAWLRQLPHLKMTLSQNRIMNGYSHPFH